MTSGIEAGNTADTLKALPVEEAVARVDPSAADLDADAAEKQIANATGQQASAAGDEVKDADPASVFVTRVEFDALVARIDRFNLGAPHKI